MKKTIILTLVISLITLMSACSRYTPSWYEEGPTQYDELNFWANHASIKELCSEFNNNGAQIVVDRILLELNRRNIDYKNCWDFR